MTSETKSNLIVAASVFAAGVLATVAAVLYLGRAQTTPATNLDAVMNAADTATQATAPKGAPMDSAAAPQGAPMDSAAGQPAAADASGPLLANGKPSLVSQESLSLLGKIDSGGDGADLFNFEKTKDGLFSKVSFKALGGFPYDVPDPEVVRAQPDPTKVPKNQVPDALMKMKGAPVLVAGFMVPIDLDANGNVRSFALTQDQMFCCYGVPPKMNQWVMVQMADGFSTDYKNNVPVAVFGKMDIGEEIEDGYVLSLYRMTSDKVVDVRELVDKSKG